MRLLAHAVALAIPLRCAACGRPPDPLLCARCTRAAQRLLLTDGAAVELADGVVAVGAFAWDGVVADAIRSVKRPGHHAAARGLGRLMWDVVAPRIPVGAWPRTWVPARPAARRARGAEIPRLLAGAGAIGYLRARVDIADQAALRAGARRRNVRGSLESVGDVPERVVCVDDVRATGATLREASRALQGGGARRVVCVTLAVAGDDARARTRR